jgi:protease I
MKACSIWCAPLPQRASRLPRCHGPQLLAAAGVIAGRRISAYPACRAEVLLAGAQYQALPMDGAVTDGPFVTGPAWPAHPAWIAQFLSVLGTKIEA